MSRKSEAKKAKRRALLAQRESAQRESTQRESAQREPQAQERKASTWQPPASLKPFNGFQDPSSQYLDMFFIAKEGMKYQERKDLSPIARRKIALILNHCDNVMTRATNHKDFDAEFVARETHQCSLSTTPRSVTARGARNLETEPRRPHMRGPIPTLSISGSSVSGPVPSDEDLVAQYLAQGGQITHALVKIRDQSGEHSIVTDNDLLASFQDLVSEDLVSEDFVSEDLAPEDLSPEDFVLEE